MTHSATVHPLPFTGDLIDYLNIHGREIEWLWHDGEAFIPVRPICDILGVSYSRQRKVLTGPESEARVAHRATPDARGHRQEMLCLAYPDFFIWLMGISLARVKEEAREAVRATRREIRELVAGHFHDRLFGEMRHYRETDQKMLLEYLMRKPIRMKVVQAVEMGWDFETLYRAHSYPRKVLVDTILELMRLKAIPHPPKATPFDLGTEPDPRQLPLFGEG